jgi:uridine kinase
VNLAAAVEAVLAARQRAPSRRAALVAISGIDASGKGYATARLAAELEARDLRVAAIGIDGWLNLPPVRFRADDPAGHFYRHAFRFDEMFARLVLPLRDNRSISLEADFAEETATAYRRHLYAWRDVDVVLLEGIYLVQSGFLPCYDLAIWIDCSFETAIERAIARGQEGLPPEETVRAFRTIYLPAQEIHFARDDPKASADLVLVNDPRLEAPRRSAAFSGRAREAGTRRCRS